MKQLIIESLSKSYGRKPVFANIDLCYRSGTVNGIIGSNGAGKSTFLNCIAGFIPYSGKIFKKNIRTVGLLTANPYMFPRITGYEFIEFCLSAKNSKTDKRRLQRLNSLFELPLAQYAEEYSTGMLKKLHLLALLLQDNDLLLLDEPFNGLDAVSSAYLVELLKELKKQDAFIFISSHDVNRLIQLADTLTIIENGTACLKPDALSDIEKEIQEAAREKV
ncbi:MAG TPA: ABC transporter ATP-binding protein, partial [Porphyromonadaceae bacterium]|nr:ABC transporter ATP-binding protein [Porphyromonadaceae bacterium]